MDKTILETCESVSKPIPIESYMNSAAEYYVEHYWNFFQNYCKKYKEMIEKSKGGK